MDKSGLSQQRFLAALESRLRRLTERRSRCRRAAITEIDRQLDLVVGGKHRNHYGAAARLVVCAAEAVTVAEGADAGTRVIGQCRERYPRHVAFRRELKRAIARAPPIEPSAAPSDQ